MDAIDWQESRQAMNVSEAQFKIRPSRSCFSLRRLVLLYSTLFAITLRAENHLAMSLPLNSQVDHQQKLLDPCLKLIWLLESDQSHPERPPRLHRVYGEPWPEEGPERSALLGKKAGNVTSMQQPLISRNQFHRVMVIRAG